MRAYDAGCCRSVDSEGSDELWMSLTGYLNPSQLFCVQPLQEQLGKPLKQLPAMFDAEGLQVQQHFSISKDGTKVPYFLVSRENLKLDGSNPTLLYVHRASLFFSCAPHAAAVCLLLLLLCWLPAEQQRGSRGWLMGIGFYCHVFLCPVAATVC